MFLSSVFSPEIFRLGARPQEWLAESMIDLTPLEKPKPVVKPGEFIFAATHLNHGHLFGQCQGLIEAGAELRYVYDADPKNVEALRQKFPQAQPVDRFETILADPDVRLVAAAAIPNERGPLGLRVMEAGKDYFTDKTPFTSLDQLAAARAAVTRTGRRYFVYFSERLHSESAVYAGQLIARGAIGRVVQVTGFGPHRLNASSRPSWFFRLAQYGGILCDIGSHQVEQYLFYTQTTHAEVVSARVANVAHPDYPELEDLGEAWIAGDNGSTNYFRVDWLTPTALRTWGDGRTFIQGTKGTIELRKYVDVARDSALDHVYLVNETVETYLPVQGKIGFPFFGEMILDCLNRTDHAMTQEHIFLAAELCLRAQQKSHSSVSPIS